MSIAIILYLFLFRSDLYSQHYMSELPLLPGAQAAGVCRDKIRRMLAEALQAAVPDVPNGDVGGVAVDVRSLASGFLLYMT